MEKAGEINRESERKGKEREIEKAEIWSMKERWRKLVGESK